MESRNPQKVIRVTLWENYGKIGKVLVNLPQTNPSTEWGSFDYKKLIS